MENKTYPQTSDFALVNEGLRQHLMKVFNFMAGGLTITALVAYICLNTPLIGLFFSVNGQSVSLSALGWLFFLAPLFMVFAFSWIVNKGTAKQVQGMFWGYSAVMGIALSPILLVYTGESIARVFLITAATFGAMSLYGYTTKRDLSRMGSFLIMALFGIIIAGFVNMFMKSSAMSYALSILSVLIFTGLTAYDIQKIRDLYVDYDYDDGETMTKKAVCGALELYLDFINIFISLLRLLGERK